MAKSKARIEAENREFKTASGVIKCLSCGHPMARLTETGLECRACGYAWTFQVEEQSAGYITTVLRRPVIVPPIVVAITKPNETDELSILLESPELVDTVEETPVKVVSKTVKGKG